MPYPPPPSKSSGFGSRRRPVAVSSQQAMHVLLSFLPSLGWGKKRKYLQFWGMQLTGYFEREIPKPSACEMARGGCGLSRPRGCSGVGSELVSLSIIKRVCTFRPGRSNESAQRRCGEWCLAERGALGHTAGLVSGTFFTSMGTHVGIPCTV